MSGKVKFFVTGPERAGTTWFVDALNNHPRISCLYEPFHPKAFWRLRRHHQFWKDDKIWIHPRDGKGVISDIGEYLERKVWTLLGPDAVGFKTADWSFITEKVGLCDYIVDHQDELRCIWLRRNPVRCYLSLYHARALDQWEARGKKILKRSIVQLDPEEVLDHVVEREAADAAIRKVVKHVCVVQYADLLQDFQRTMKGVLGWLGIDWKPMSSDLKKLQPGGFRDLVSNWEEVAAVLPPELRAMYFRPNDPMT